MLTSNKSVRLIGHSAIYLVEHFPSLLPNIMQYTFVRYTPMPGVDLRVQSKANTDILETVDQLKSEHPLFTNITEQHAVMFAVRASRDPIKTIDQMLLHYDVDKNAMEFTLSCRELSTKGLSNVMKSLNEEEALGLSSRCISSNGEIVHIPVLDFLLPPNPLNQKLIEHAACSLKLRYAAILESGRSYHLYGLETISQEDWLRFMYRTLLLTPIIDSRYIAHRLLEGQGVLRINAPLTKPIEPKIVAIIEQ